MAALRLAMAPMAPRTWVSLILIAMMFAGGCRKDGESGETAAKPNIILITLESIRTDHVGHFGYDRDTTPAFDELSRQGITFTQANAVTSWTLPSHASMFTGLYPSAHQVVTIRDRLDDDYTTAAELLRDSGYQTAGFISGPFLRKVHNLQQGFDTYDDSFANVDHWASHEDITNPGMEKALTAFLKNGRHPDKPFFLFLYFWDPHFDYIPPSPYDKMFVPSDAVPIDVRRYEHQTTVNKNITKSQLAYVVSQYDGEIRCTDAVLGRLWSLLKKLDLWDTTAVIVTADHGEDFFERGKKGHKNDIFAQSIRVPLVIKPPGHTKPRRDERITSLVDLFPTICDLAGVVSAGSTHGRSLLKAASGSPRTIYFELDALMYMTHPDTGRSWTEADRWRGVRRGRYKLVSIPEKNRWALFDVQADPTEMHPLGPDHGGNMAALRTLLEQYERDMRAVATRKGKPRPADLNEEELKRLESLGYIDRRKADDAEDDR
ncbi:MAG: sulfatase [Planctomycetes bacterium]|nr:sulfatase [Planctomycetota bacterium]